MAGAGARGIRARAGCGGAARFSVGRARCDGRPQGLLLLTRVCTMRAENRRRWSGRGGGGVALAAVAAAWLSSRHRATLGGSCLEDGAPRWPCNGQALVRGQGVLATAEGYWTSHPHHCRSGIRSLPPSTCPPSLCSAAYVHSSGPVRLTGTCCFWQENSSLLSARDSGGDLDGLGD